MDEYIDWEIEPGRAGAFYMSVNDEWLRLDAPPRIVNDRPLIPLRAVAETFGAQVGWDEATQTVTVELD